MNEYLKGYTPGEKIVISQKNKDAIKIILRHLKRGAYTNQTDIAQNIVYKYPDEVIDEPTIYSILIHNNFIYTRSNFLHRLTWRGYKLKKLNGDIDAFYEWNENRRKSIYIKDKQNEILLESNVIIAKEFIKTKRWVNGLTIFIAFSALCVSLWDACNQSNSVRYIYLSPERQQTLKMRKQMDSLHAEITNLSKEISKLKKSESLPSKPAQR